MLSCNDKETGVQWLEITICVCVILKGLTRYNCYQCFRGAPFKVWCEGLDECTLFGIVQSIQAMWQDDVSRQCIYFVETTPTTEHLIDTFCSKLETNYVIVDVSKNDASETLEKIFNKLLRHRPIPLNYKKLF